MIPFPILGLQKNANYLIGVSKKMFGAQQFYLSFFFLFLVKSVFLVFYKPGFEIDSWNYVECVLSFDYPPVYPYFLYLIRSFSSNVYITCLVQVFLFSLGASVFGYYFFKKRWQLIAFVVLAGIDPASGYNVCTIMSEALFIPLLLVFFVFLHRITTQKEHGVLYLIMLGCTGGLMYLTRFAGVFFMLSAVCLIVFQKQDFKLSVKSLLIVLLSFQFTLLPVRYKYYVNFGTIQFNGFSGRMLWNNVSGLYPESEVRKKPIHTFETYLVQFPDSYFTQELALGGRQLWEDTLPLRSYYRFMKVAYGDMPTYDWIVFKTALRLIAEKPFLYFTTYVIPNFTKIASESDSIYAKGYEKKIDSVYHFLIYPKKVWHKHLTGLFLLLLFISVVFYIAKKRNGGTYVVILFSCCFYVLLLPFFSILDSRLYLVLSLPIVAVFLMEWFGESTV